MAKKKSNAIPPQPKVVEEVQVIEPIVEDPIPALTVETPKSAPPEPEFNPNEMFDDPQCTRPGYKYYRDGRRVPGSGIY